MRTILYFILAGLAGAMVMLGANYLIAGPDLFDPYSLSLKGSFTGRELIFLKTFGFYFLLSGSIAVIFAFLFFNVQTLMKAGMIGSIIAALAYITLVATGLNPYQVLINNYLGLLIYGLTGFTTVSTLFSCIRFIRIRIRYDHIQSPVSIFA